MADRSVRKWISLIENYVVRDHEEFYHGSSSPLPEGTILEPRGPGCDEEIEEILERNRPPSAPNRRQCVYMVDNIRSLDTVLAHYDYLYVVEPQGSVARYDAIWLNRMFSSLSMIDNGIEVSTEELDKIAQGYWSGQACPRQHGEQVAWEFLCSAAEVVEAIDDD